MENQHFKSISSSITHCKFFGNPKLVDGVLHHDITIKTVRCLSPNSTIVVVGGDKDELTGSFDIANAEFEHSNRMYHFPDHNVKIQFLGLTVL